MTSEQIAMAQKMRDGGMVYQEIGDEMGMSLEAIRYNLDPKAKQKQVEYKQANKEKIAKRNASWYQDNKEERAQYHAEWYRANAEKVNKRVREYYQEHRQDRRQYAVEYGREHKDERAKYSSGYYQSNRDEIAKHQHEHLAERSAYQAKRRALKNGALIGATVAQLAEIKEIYRKAKEEPKIRCYLCGELIPVGHRHVDHIVPLSKGGAHRPSNLAVACDVCNLRKHAKMPNEVGLLI